MEKNMEIEVRIGNILTPTLDRMGYEIVRVQISGVQQKTMQIMAERKDRLGMTVEDCADISREVSAILDVENFFQDAYDLEVSSPGIDRPLVHPADFERYAGFDAKIEMAEPIDGRKKFKGQLLGIEKDQVKIRLDKEAYKLSVSNIRRAKLLLTEDLLKAASLITRG